MLYKVKLPDTEVELLAALIGCPLDRVVADGWSVSIESGATRLSVIPADVSTPDAEHRYADVDRPMVRAAAASASTADARWVGERLGPVRDIHIISILVGFTSVEKLPPQTLAPGVVLPESTAYGEVCYAPRDRERAAREVGSGALVDLDIAIELTLGGRESLVLYTRGYAVEASPRGLPDDEEWSQSKGHERRSITPV